METTSTSLIHSKADDTYAMSKTHGDYNLIIYFDVGLKQGLRKFIESTIYGNITSFCPFFKTYKKECLAVLGPSPIYNTLQLNIYSVFCRCRTSLASVAHVKYKNERARVVLLW